MPPPRPAGKQISILFRDDHETTGLWAPTVQWRSLALSDHSTDGLTLESPGVREALVKWAEGGGYDGWWLSEGRLVRLRSGNLRGATVNAWMFAVDAALVLLTVLTVCAFPHRKRLLPIHIRADNRESLLRRGLCPKCRYNVGPTRDYSGVCPECGESIAQ
ncbi:MAG: hypothetical protein Q8L55_12080 [Phycisphaerales bacterium]|nr:hypothetical protein [Phycisphaerales bacterium]